MADDMEKNRQQGGQTGQGQYNQGQPGQQKDQTGQQKDQSGQQSGQKKGGQNQTEDEDRNQQRRAS